MCNVDCEEKRQVREKTEKFDALPNIGLGICVAIQASQLVAVNAGSSLFAGDRGCYCLGTHAIRTPIINCWVMWHIHFGCIGVLNDGQCRICTDDYPHCASQWTLYTP